MELTTKLSLKKPGLTDYVNVSDLNENMDTLDTEVGALKEGTTEVVGLETIDKTYKGAINEIKNDLGEHKAEKASDINRPHGLGSIAKEIYEEGTWTPRIGGNYAGGTYSKQIGAYTRIGNRVFLKFEIQVGTKGTGSTAIVIEGLPFNRKLNQSSFVNLEVFGMNLNLYIDAFGQITPTGPAYILLNFKKNDGTIMTLPLGNIQDGTYILGEFSYLIA